MNIYRHVNEDYYNPDRSLSIAKVLHLVEENDPSVQAIQISISPYQVSAGTLKTLPDFERVGRAVAKNTNLEALILSVQYRVKKILLADKHPMKGPHATKDPPDYKIHLKRLLELLCENRSIIHFESRGDHELELLAPLESFFSVNESLNFVRLSDWTAIASNTQSLMTAIVKRQSSLDTLCIERCTLRDEGVKEITLILKNCPEVSPKKLYLGGNSIGDGGCFYISDAITNTEIDLKEIDLSRNSSIGLPGLQSISTALAMKERPFEKLGLSFIPFGDAGFSELVEAFLDCPKATPKYLRLRYCRIYNSYRKISRLLHCPDCSLERIDLRNNSRLQSDTADNILDSLQNNTTLKEIYLSEIRSNSLWEKLVPLIFNTTSITATYASNHSLVYFGDRKSQPLLVVNKHPNKKAVAAFKVIDHYFAHNFDVRSFEKMGAPILAEMIAFVNQGFEIRDKDILGVRENSSSGKGDSSSDSDGDHGCRENNNLTINYIIARNMPALFGFVKL